MMWFIGSLCTGGSYPGEAVLVAIIVAIVPYLVIRPDLPIE